MKKMLLTFLIVMSVLCPVHFGLAELTLLSGPPSVARRVELPERQKEAPRIAALETTTLRVGASSGKKHIRRPLHTGGEPLNFQTPAAVYATPPAGRIIPHVELFINSSFLSSQYLRAPPALL